MITMLEQAARQRRFRLFKRLFSTIAGSDRRRTILDVGGTWAYWRQMNWAVLGNIEVLLLNLFVQENLPPCFKSVIGDARDLSNYSEQQFDLVYSNSVLSLVGTFADQERMAREIRRVGRRYLVQTPNRWFVIDWRTLIPFFHFLPTSSQAWCFRHFRVGTYPRIKDYASSYHQAGRIRDVTCSELKKLFPGGTIVRERVLGLTKSFVVHSGFMRMEEDGAISPNIRDRETVRRTPD